jgi:anti-sigma factor ChrR (cupin superfamily)
LAAACGVFMTMLNCREVSERASEYVDASLTWRTRLQMWMHLMMCRYCREYVRQMALVTRTLPRLPRQRPDQPTYEALMALFRSERS